MLEEKRKREHKKYESAYHGVYGMGRRRKLAAFDAIRSLEMKGSFLDVGCGRGEILDFARKEGFSPVVGTDVVQLNEEVVYGEVYALPFGEFDVVTCFDVLEHVLPEDTIPALIELSRVAKKAAILAIANYESKHEGVDLHINLRPYEEWDCLIREHFDGSVEWVKDNNHSKTWIIRRET